MPVSERNIKRFKRATAQLNKVIADCNSDDGRCFVYLDASATLFLMDGSLSVAEEGVHDTVIAYSNLTAGGGDW